MGVPSLNDLTIDGTLNTNKQTNKHEIVILKQQNAKIITDASIWVKLISKNSNTLEIENSLLTSPTIISRYGFHLRSTDLDDKLHSYDSGTVYNQTTNTLLC